MRQSQRSGRISPFHVMALLERAQALQAQGADVIHLEVGEPDFPTPAPIVAAGQQALAAGLTRYSPAAGIPALRQALSDYYRQRFAVDVPPQRIILTPGASGALQLALSALVDAGDGVLMSDPGYPCNRHFVRLLDGDCQMMPLSAAGRASAEGVAAAWRDNTVAALLASPDNPTGAVLSTQELSEIAAVVAQRDGALIMDEIYQGLVYDGDAHTVLSVAPDSLVINSFSKFFGMTGWRLGWLVAPASLVPALERMAQNFFLAPPTVAQHAALAAFSAETMAELSRRRDLLAARRALLLERLPALGVTVTGEPAGAFYLYLDVSAITGDSFAFCQQLLEQAHVALTPGLDFGEGHGPGRYVRLAYTTGLERLEEALSRIARFVAGGTDAV